MILAEMGAEVIKVEQTVTGDGMRDVIPGCFDYLNGNKRFITLNLKHEKGIDLFMKIAEKVDVIVEGFRPGAAKRLGIDFDSVKKNQFFNYILRYFRLWADRAVHQYAES